jgi:transcription elongation factor GreB
MNKVHKNYITPLGFKKLQDELDQLVKVERPELTKVIAWAASNGDRSENADYIYGKKRLREIDRRIRFLVSRIDKAEVIDPIKHQTKNIQFGATVTISDEEGLTRKISIVGVDEINTNLGHLSWRSPIGGSLLGKSEGDAILVRTPKGEVEFDIVSVEYCHIRVEISKDEILEKEEVEEGENNEN